MSLQQRNDEKILINEMDAPGNHDRRDCKVQRRSGYKTSVQSQIKHKQGNI